MYDEYKFEIEKVNIKANHRTVKAEYTLELTDFSDWDIAINEFHQELNHQLIREIVLAATIKTPEFIRAQMNGHEEVYLMVREYFPELRVEGDWIPKKKD